MESKTPESPHVQHIDPPGDKPGSMEASNEITLPADIEGPWPSYLAKRWRMILRMSIIYIAVLSVGFDNSVTNTTLGMPAFRRYFGHQTEAGDYVIPAKYVSAWAGGTFGGQVLTDLVGGYLADRIGRKWTLCLSVIVIIIASTIQITAHSIGQIIAGKTVFGMGVGLYISFVTSYTAELAPTRVRGMACMGVNFCIKTGNWIGSGAALGLFNRYPNVNDTRSFRIIFSLQYLFASLFLLTVWWLPESPSFHIHRDDVDKAEKVIAQLYDPDYDSKRHVAFLVQEHEAEKASLGVGKSIGWGELFKGRNPLRMMISACIVWPLLMGTAFWPSYQSYYFELAGATNAQAMNYGCTSVAIGTSIIAYMLIENVGRRRLWLFGATGMACSNLIGGFMYIPVVNGNARVAGKVATAMVFLWNGFYDIGPANMGYAITSEVPSSRMRVKNNAFVHVGSHLTGFALSYAVPYMYNPDAGNLGLRMGFIWGGFSVIFVIWGFFIPDVTGLNFYQIDQLFESRAPVRKFHQAKFDDNGLLIRSFSTRTSGEVS